MTNHTCEFVEVLYTYGGDVVARRCPRCLAICAVCPTCARYPMPKRGRCECQRKASRAPWHYPRVSCECGCGERFEQWRPTHLFASRACSKRWHRRQRRAAK